MDLMALFFVRGDILIELNLDLVGIDALGDVIFQRLKRLDHEVFRSDVDGDLETTPLPLEGRKLHLHVDWARSELDPRRDGLPVE